MKRIDKKLENGSAEVRWGSCFNSDSKIHISFDFYDLFNCREQLLGMERKFRQTERWGIRKSIALAD